MHSANLKNRRDLGSFARLFSTAGWFLLAIASSVAGGDPPANRRHVDPAVAARAKLRLSTLTSASTAEAVSVLRFAADTIDETLKAGADVSVLDAKSELPKNFDEFDARMWEAHVFRGQLEEVLAISSASEQFQEKFMKARTGNVQLNALPNYTPVDYAEKTEQIESQLEELFERRLSLQNDRIEFAISTLNAISDPDFASEKASKSEQALQRLWAGFSLRQDGDEVLVTLNKADEADENEFQLIEAFATAESRSKTRKRIKSSQKRAGDLLLKSAFLFDGLHWWFRGRYGRGTDNYGLLKTAEAANDMRKQNEIQLPRQLPVPTNPAIRPALADGDTYDADAPRYPDYDRRHHYIWSQKPSLFLTQKVGVYFH